MRMRKPDIRERCVLQEGPIREEKRRPGVKAQTGSKSMEGIEGSKHEGMAKSRPVMLWTEGHENLRVYCEVPMGSKEHCTIVTKGEEVPFRMPDEFVGEAVRKDEGSLFVGE